MFHHQPCTLIQASRESIITQRGRGALRRLRELSEQLDPLESAYADVRFLEVDVEQTGQHCESLMSALAREVEEEKLMMGKRGSLEEEIGNLNSLVESAGGDAEQLSSAR